MIEFFAQPVYQKVALTLLHFLWQGAFVGALLAVCLKLLRDSQLRYAACCGALLAIVLLPALTFSLVSVPTPYQKSPSVVQQSPAIVPAGNAIPAMEPIEPIEDAAIVEVESSADAEPKEASVISAIGPYCVLVWMLGTLLFGGRLLLGYVATRRLHSERSELPQAMRSVVYRLAKRMRLGRIPQVFTSERVRDAMVVGFYRPVVLLPLSWLTQLPPEVLRSVIAHELAHIRRYDQWVNLLQRIVESILFYHPVVWWISNRTRAEREYRCDELALTATGGAVQYAEALERVARVRLFEKEPLLANSMGGTRMALLKRVKNVLGMSDSPRRTWWAVGLLAVCLPAFLVALSIRKPEANAENVARFDGEEEREREGGDRRKAERREGERREGERRERGEARRREGERRERDRREGEGRERDRREGDRRKADRRREGDRPRGERREGDRDRKEGDRRRDDERREGRRDGDRPPRRGERRDGDRREPPRGGGNLRELLEAIRQLRSEVARLRKEVDQLKGKRPRRDGEGGDARPRRRDGDGDRDRGDARREGDRRRGERDRRPRREGDQPVRN